MIRNRLLLGMTLVVVSTFLFSACTNSTAQTEPDLIGWIDSVQQAQGYEKPGQLLVNAPDNNTSDKFIVTVTDKTLISKQIGEALKQVNLDTLSVGQ